MPKSSWIFPALAVALFAVATALPAAAHGEVLSGTTTCSNGAHLITWSIGNTNTPLAMHVVTATATLNGGQQFHQKILKLLETDREKLHFRL